MTAHRQPPPSPPTPPVGAFRERIVRESQRLGFEAIGFARADVPLDADFARYEAFVDAEKHGEMTWLASLREARQRLNGDHILPNARTAICLARRYTRGDDSADADVSFMESTIARYARGRDYHNGMRKKLRKLAALVRTMVVDDDSGNRTEARPLCDEEPVLERAWAARAGLGFVGKNGLLIVPGVGSFVLLGEVVTTLAIDADLPMFEKCGSCTRCLDACPTKAFDEAFVLDPRKCIAYLTIEHRTAIDPSLRPNIGTHLFGCDDCQTVCPFNASKSARATAPVDARLEADPRWRTTRMEELLSLDDDAFVRLREGSAIGRATRVGLARNAAIVLGNRGDVDAIAALEKARDTHDSPMVREAASWAIAQLRSR